MPLFIDSKLISEETRVGIVINDDNDNFIVQGMELQQLMEAQRERRENLGDWAYYTGQGAAITGVIAATPTPWAGVAIAATGLLGSLSVSLGRLSQTNSAESQAMIAEIGNQMLADYRQSIASHQSLNQNQVRMDLAKRMLNYAYGPKIPEELRPVMQQAVHETVLSEMGAFARNIQLLQDGISGLQEQEHENSEKFTTLFTASQQLAEETSVINQQLTTLHEQNTIQNRLIRENTQGIADNTKAIAQNSLRITELRVDLLDKIDVLSKTAQYQGKQITQIASTVQVIFRQLNRINDLGISQYDEVVRDLKQEYDKLLSYNAPEEQFTAAATKLAAAISHRLLLNEELGGYVNIAMGAANIFGQLAFFTDIPELQKVGQLIQGVTQLAVGMFSVASSLVANLAKGLAGSAAAILGTGPLAGPMAIATGISAIISVFSGSKEDGVAKMLQQIMEQIADLSKQVRHQGIHFDNRFNNQNDLMRSIAAGQIQFIERQFDELTKLIDQNQQIILREFSLVKGDLSGIMSLVSTLVEQVKVLAESTSAGFRTLFLQERTAALDIVNYYDNQPYDDPRVPRLQSRELRDTLRAVMAFAEATTDPVFHNDLASANSPELLLAVSQFQNAVNLLRRVLSHPDGYGITFETPALSGNLTDSFDPTRYNCQLPTPDPRLINPEAYRKATADIFKFFFNVPELNDVLIPSDRCFLQPVIAKLEQYIQANLAFKTNADLFPTIITRYVQSLNRVSVDLYLQLVRTFDVFPSSLQQSIRTSESALDSYLEQLYQIRSEQQTIQDQLTEVVKIILDSCTLLTNSNNQPIDPTNGVVCYEPGGYTGDFDFFRCSKPSETDLITKDAENCHADVNFNALQEALTKQSAVTTHLTALISEAEVTRNLLKQVTISASDGRLLLNGTASTFKEFNAKLTALFPAGNTINEVLTTIGRNRVSLLGQLRSINGQVQQLILGVTGVVKECHPHIKYRYYISKETEWNGNVKHHCSSALAVDNTQTDIFPIVSERLTRLNSLTSNSLSIINGLISLESPATLTSLVTLLNKASAAAALELSPELPSNATNTTVEPLNRPMIQAMQNFINSRSDSIVDLSNIADTFTNYLNSADGIEALKAVDVHLHTLLLTLQFTFGDAVNTDAITQEFIRALWSGSEIKFALEHFDFNDPASFALGQLEATYFLIHQGNSINVIQAFQQRLDRTIAENKQQLARGNLAPAFPEDLQLLADLRILRNNMIPDHPLHTVVAQRQDEIKKSSSIWPIIVGVAVGATLFAAIGGYMYYRRQKRANEALTKKATDSTSALAWDNSANGKPVNLERVITVKDHVDDMLDGDLGAGTLARPIEMAERVLPSKVADSVSQHSVETVTTPYTPRHTLSSVTGAVVGGMTVVSSITGTEATTNPPLTSECFFNATLSPANQQSSNALAVYKAPPLFSQESLTAAGTSIIQGAISGVSKLANEYINRNGNARNIGTLSQGLVYYTLMFVKHYNDRLAAISGVNSYSMYSDAEKNRAWDQAMGDTLVLALFQMLFQMVTAGLDFAATQSKKHGLQKTAKVLNGASRVSQIGFFGYQARNQGIYQTTANVVAGAATELATLSVGRKALSLKK